MTDLASVLQGYTCHKKVQAAEITSVGQMQDGARSCPVTLAGVLTLDAPANMFSRYVPVPGDYLVVYEDGYQSFSPKSEFLKGYTANGESFADIKEGLKK